MEHKQTIMKSQLSCPLDMSQQLKVRRSTKVGAWRVPLRRVASFVSLLLGKLLDVAGFSDETRFLDTGKNIAHTRTHTRTTELMRLIIPMFVCLHFLCFLLDSAI